MATDVSLVDAQQICNIDVIGERWRQLKKFGVQRHPNGTGGEKNQLTADTMRRICQAKFAAGEGTWRDVLAEEVFEAFAEDEPNSLRAELVQVAAVAVAWIEAIDAAEKEFVRRLFEAPLEAAHADD